MKLKNHQKGFTLIELMVVISIIGLLASIVLASLSNARSLARDAQRISDIRQIRLALELYRNDNETYPTEPYWANSTDSASWTDLQSKLGKYMPNMPKDPLNDGTNPWTGGVGHYSYSYGFDLDRNGDETSYDLVAQLENPSSGLINKKHPWIFHALINTQEPTIPHGTEIMWPVGDPYVYTGEQ